MFCGFFFLGIHKSINGRQLSRQIYVRVKVSEQKYLLSLSFIFYFVSGVHNQGKATSLVYISLEAPFEEPLTTSFIYRCFLCVPGDQKESVHLTVMLVTVSIFHTERERYLRFHQAILLFFENSGYGLICMK